MKHASKLRRLKLALMILSFLFAFAVPEISSADFPMVWAPHPSEALSGFRASKKRVIKYLSAKGHHPNDYSYTWVPRYKDALKSGVPQAVKETLFSIVVSNLFPLYQHIQDDSEQSYPQRLKNMDAWADEYLELVRSMLEMGANLNAYARFYVRVYGKTLIATNFNEKLPDVGEKALLNWWNEDYIVPIWTLPILGRHWFIDRVAQLNKDEQKKEFPRRKVLLLREKALLEKLATLFSKYQVNLDLPAYHIRVLYTKVMDELKVEVLTVKAADQWLEWYGRRYLRWAAENSRVRAGNLAYKVDAGYLLYDVIGETFDHLTGWRKGSSPIHRWTSGGASKYFKTMKAKYRAATRVRIAVWKNHKHYIDFIAARRRVSTNWVREIRRAVMARTDYTGPEERKLELQMWNNKPVNSESYSWEKE